MFNDANPSTVAVQPSSPIPSNGIAKSAMTQGHSESGAGKSQIQGHWNDLHVGLQVISQIWGLEKENFSSLLMACHRFSVTGRMKDYQALMYTLINLKELCEAENEDIRYLFEEINDSVNQILNHLCGTKYGSVPCATKRKSSAPALPRNEMLLNRTKNKTMVQRVHHRIRMAITPIIIESFQKELDDCLKKPGVKRGEVVNELRRRGFFRITEQNLTSWRTGRDWGPENPEVIEALGEILDSNWISENWKEVGACICQMIEANKYARTTDSYLQKAPRRHPRWTREEQAVLQKAGLKLEDLRACYEKK